MKILHINFSKEGGASIGMRRFHDALKIKKINSELFYFVDQLKINKNKNFNILIKWKLLILLKKIFLKFFTKLNNKESLSLNYFKMLEVETLINQKKPDIIHLHWIGNEMISIRDISRIQIPIVWTFHDMWPFSGGEHFSTNYRYVKSYKKETRLLNEKGIDINKFIWEVKYKYLKNKEIYVVCPSTWIKERLNKDKIFKNNTKTVIPYIIDKNKWKAKLEINKKKRVKKTNIIFVATSSVDYRKGFKYLYNALEKYLNKNEYKLHYLGVKSKYFDQLSIDKKYFGHVNNYKKLKKIYLESDILVGPSIQESFGQIYIEAGICGLPCVAFRDTAAKDIIKHRQNGYLAKYKSSKDLAKGIEWCKENLSNNLTKKNKIKKIIIKKFSYDKINILIKLYKSIINKSHLYNAK